MLNSFQFFFLHLHQTIISNILNDEEMITFYLICELHYTVESLNQVDTVGAKKVSAL